MVQDNNEMPAVAPPDWDNIPASLAERQQWLLWKFERKEGQAKPGKIPYYVIGGRRTGDQGSDRDRARLATLPVVRKAFERGGWSGVGFAFLPGDGLIGIDVDGAVDVETGQVSERLQRIIQACNSFTEYSPSGKGAHIIVLGHTTTNKSNDIGLEVFCERQFFTVTGRRWPDTPPNVEPISEGALKRLHATIDEAKAAARAQAAAARPSAAPAAAVPPPPGGNDFERVNQAAMGSLPVWVPSLFPAAIGRGTGYRVTSKSLGRDLQEDLSITPEGIVDFGVADMGDALRRVEIPPKPPRAKKQLPLGERKTRGLPVEAVASRQATTRHGTRKTKRAARSRRRWSGAANARPTAERTCFTACGWIRCCASWCG